MKSKMTLDKIADRYLSHNSRHTQVPVSATIRDESKKDGDDGLLVLVSFQ